MRPFAPLLISSLLFISIARAQTGTPTAETSETQQAGRGERLSTARAYIDAGRYYEASKLAKQLLSENPGDLEAAEVRNQAQRELQKIADETITRAEAAAAGAEGTDQARLALADAYFEAGRYLAASKAYAAHPTALRSREVRLKHARALAWDSKTYDAEALYLELIREQSDPELELEYGRVLSWMGASRAAIARLAAAYSANPSDETAIALANARAWSGDRDGAITLLRARLETNPLSQPVRTLLDEMSQSPNLRLERVDRLIEAEPYNLALRMERARMLMEAGRYGEVRRTLEFVEEHSTKEVAGLAELKRASRERRLEAVARVKEERGALDSTPSEPEAILALAKAYVGLEEYDEAAELYDRYLELRPDDLEARIQYARMLSWDRRYSAASREYDRILEQYPERADLRLEYAQILSWNDEYVPAIRTFRRLTDLSENPRAHLYTDVPTKAHFNLGQIYRWFGWQEHALDEQNQAIELDGSFTPARRELDLVRHVRPATSLGGTYTEAENSNGFRHTRIDFEGAKWTSPRTAIDVLVGRHTFERTDRFDLQGNDQVAANVFGVGGRYRWQDRWLARARVGINAYEDGVGTRPFWNAGAEWLPSLQSRAAFDYARYDLVYDVFTIESLRDDPIDIDDFRAHYDYASGGLWSVLGNVTYGFISDDNKRFGAHGLVSLRVLKEPFVAFKIDGRHLSHDFRSRRYWSPTDYNSLAGVLHVGSNIRERLFWQVELKYGRSWEGENQSDVRAIESRVTVPINDAFDLVGGYADGQSGRIEAPFGNEDFVNYWQRRWYVGVRVKRLFLDDERRGRNPYYFEERPYDASPVLEPIGGRP